MELQGFCRVFPWLQNLFLSALYKKIRDVKQRVLKCWETKPRLCLLQGLSRKRGTHQEGSECVTRPCYQRQCRGCFESRAFNGWCDNHPPQQERLRVLNHNALHIGQWLFETSSALLLVARSCDTLRSLLMCIPLFLDTCNKQNLGFVSHVYLIESGYIL